MTSEEVHWLFGGVISAVSLALLVIAQSGRTPSAASFIVPATVIAAGIALVFDLWLHGSAAPANYAAETAQHLLLGSTLIAVGAAELTPKILGWRGCIWRLPVVAAFFIAGAIFFFHEQHMTGDSMRLMSIQHRVFGVTLALSAAARLWTVARNQDPDTDRSWLLLTLLFGITLPLYTESGAPMDMHNAATLQ